MVVDDSTVHRISAPPHATDTPRCSILVVEDDPLTQAHITALLEANGYPVTSVPSIQQARQAVSAVYYPVVVLDRQLADGDGLTLCAELRAARRASRVFVLMLSGRASPLDVGEGMRAGADVYLSKQTSDAELLAYLDAAATVAEFGARSRTAAQQ